ncbi:MAG: transporter permease [Thermomicrobiales bacterium]|nr:transporter permease [Thermomicrobiales bacterium]MDF3040063.1 transporter permease [Thermomicrobiales bacterium]
MDGVFNALYQFQVSFSLLLLSAIGLAVIFGMMGVINLAHGEFMMLGAYITTIAGTHGVPLALAMLLGALGVGLFGAVMEIVVVRRLYGRLLDTVAATWAVGLILSQGTLILTGPSMQGISSPFGSFTVGATSYSWYRVVLGVVSVVLLAGLYLLFMKTKYGLRARATIQNPAIARALGVDTARMYTITFALGSALAGLAGGLFAPTATIVPFFGVNYIVEAFVTVIVGGANALIGTPIAAAFLGAINAALGTEFGLYIGRVGLLLTTIIIIRVLPNGISGLIDRWRMRPTGGGRGR